jgi:hypothetical protein
MKFEEDMTKFNNYQANRWKNLQEKLDSVHVIIIDYNFEKTKF